MRLTVDALISVLALLLLLGGALWLPLVGASPSANLSATLSVLGEDDDEDDDGGGGSSGVGSGGVDGDTTSNPQPPTTPPAAPPVVQPEPRPIVLTLTPKTIPNFRAATITVYGHSLHGQLEVRITSGATTLITASGVGIATDDDESSALEALSYDIPPNSLETGAGTASILYQGTLLREEAIWIYGRANPLSLRGQAISKTLYATARAGDEIALTATIRNLGQTSWDPAVDPLNIGTSGPRDRQSRFKHPSWIYTDRVANIPLSDTVIAPSQTVAVPIMLLAPPVQRRTTFIERFAVVADGLAWIPNSEFNVIVTVLPTTTPAPLVGQSSAPNTTPQLPAVTEPGAPIPQDALTPIGSGFNLLPQPSAAAPTSPAPYKLPGEVKSIARRATIKTALTNWFVKPLTSLFSAIGRWWR